MSVERLVKSHVLLLLFRLCIGSLCAMASCWVEILLDEFSFLSFRDIDRIITRFCILRIYFLHVCQTDYLCHFKQGLPGAPGLKGDSGDSGPQVGQQASTWYPHFPPTLCLHNPCLVCLHSTTALVSCRVPGVFRVQTDYQGNQERGYWFILHRIPEAIYIQVFDFPYLSPCRWVSQMAEF